MISRRAVLRTAALAWTAKGPASAAPVVRIGAMDGTLRMRGKVEAFALAASLGLEGVEVNLVKAPEAESLALSDAGLQSRYLAASAEHRVPIAGVVVSMLHVNHFKSDPVALKWVHEGIRIAGALRVKVVLLPFFGPAATTGQAERERVADLLKDFVPEARRAGVVLGVENTLSAEDNARLLERTGSSSAGVYYDVGNSTNLGGFDAVKEIRWLGKDRICQIHLKDKGYLGEGTVNFPEVMRAIRDIGFQGFANLETASPSGSVDADVRRNLAYLRRLIAGNQAG